MSEKVGQVLELFISKKDNTQRYAKKIIEVDREGIIGDKFYAKDIERSILLTSIDSYQLALKNNIEISYGVLGENILIDYNPYHLVMGSKIQIGEVVLEVTQNCTICNHLSSIDRQLPSLLKDDRGIFVKVLKEGIIANNEKVLLLK